MRTLTCLQIGSVIFNFSRKGRLALLKEIDEETLLELAIEAGVDGDVSIEEPDPDGRNDGEEVKSIVLTEASELGAVQATASIGILLEKARPVI